MCMYVYVLSNFDSQYEWKGDVEIGVGNTYDVVGIRSNGCVTGNALSGQNLNVADDDENTCVCSGFTNNDKVVIEVNQPERYIKLWKNGTCIVHCGVEVNVGGSILPIFEFYCRVENSEDKNMFKNIKYYVRSADISSKDDKYQTNQQLLHVLTGLQSIKKTMRDLNQDRVISSADSGIFTHGSMACLFDIDRLQTRIVEDDAKVSSNEWEKFDVCLKDLDEKILSRMMDNLSNIKSKIGNLRNDREKKRSDPEYYKDWSIEDVGKWIDNIENGKFSDYSQELKGGMKKHDLTAADIKDINQLGLKLLGVSQCDENQRKCLAHHLQSIDDKQATQRQENVTYDEEYIVENVY